MTIFTDGLRLESPGRPVADYAASFGAQIGATAEEGLFDSPTAQLYGVAELEGAKRSTFRMPATDPLGNPVSVAEESDEGPSVPTVPRAEAVDRVKQAGLEKRLTLPEGDTIAAPALDIMIRRARDRAEREATIARGPQNIFASAAGLGTSFLVGAIDPINIGASFIPVMGELRYGKLLASAGESALGRAAIRGGVGAAQGAVGQAALEPLDWYSHTQDGRDFGMSDVLHNLVFGAALGGTLHAGGGAIADVIRRRRGEAVYPFGAGEPGSIERAPVVEPDRIEPVLATIDEVLGAPAAPARGILRDMPPRAQEDSMRAAVASIVDGEPVNVGEMLQAAAKGDPRIADSFEAHEPFQPQSLSAEARQWPEPPEGARIVRQGDHGPEIEGLQDRWQETVNWLSEAQAGDARGVLAHPDVPGGRIDVIWGNEAYGLQHIAALHPEVLPDLPERLAAMTLQRVHQAGRPGERLELAGPDGAKAIVRTAFDGEKKIWLLTAYTPESDYRGRGGGTTGSPSEGPAQSPASPKETIGPESPPGKVGEDDWRSLLQRADEVDQPDVVQASREAEAMPEPVKTKLDERVAAAEKADAESAELYKMIAETLPEAERTRLDDALRALDEDHKLQSAIIERSGACLFGARG